MSEAQPKQKRPRDYRTHGHYGRVKWARVRGFNAIPGTTYAGREAKRWRTCAIQQKGNGNVQMHTRQEIDLAMFDLWLLLELGEALARDARKRGTVLNRRRKTLPNIHEQYNQVSLRFSKRCEALELDKPVEQLDLARRIMLQQAQADASGGVK